MLKAIYLFLTAFLASVLLAPLIKRLALKYKIMAQPREDRWHKKPTPLLGGMGIYLSFLVTYLIFRPAFDYQILGFLFGASFILCFGFLDDIIHLKPQVKLLAQIIAGCIAVSFGILPEFNATPLLLIALSIFWIVAITNSINLLDNMDGLACGISSIAFIFIFISSLVLKTDGIGLIALILAASSLGFLPFNLNPAKIFMGDSGSMFLGYSLACITLMGEPSNMPSLIATLAIPVLILAVPIFDTTLVTLVRIIKGRSILQGGKDHVSHRLVSLGLSEKRAVFLLYFLSILFGLIGLLYSRFNVVTIALFSTLTVIILLFFGIFLAEIETYKEGQIEKERSKKIREGKVVLNTSIFNKRMIVEVLVDLTLVCVAYYSAYLLRYDGKINPINQGLIQNSLPLIIIIRLFCFWYFGLYRGIWRYIGINDLISIFKAVSLSSILIVLALTFQFRFGDYSRVVFVIDWLLALFFLTSIRIFIRALDEYFSRYRLGKKKVLIIGASDTGEMILREIKRSEAANYNPVGFIDDNPSKIGRAIHGVPILGTRKDIESIIREKGVEEVILAMPSLSCENPQEIFAACAAANVPYREVYGMMENGQR